VKQSYELVLEQMQTMFDLARDSHKTKCFWCNEPITAEDMAGGYFHEEPVNFGKETGYWHLPCKEASDHADAIDRIHDEWMDEIMERGNEAA
jgi:hypothetical protein